MHVLGVVLCWLVAAPADPVQATLHPEVQKRIEVLRTKMRARRRQVVLNSGARRGDPADSLHNQSLAADVQISGMSSVNVAKALRGVGFSCAIPYFDNRGRACRMAHGDLRHTVYAEGPYALGSAEKTCPALAVSRTGGCHNDSKGQWTYYGKWPARFGRRKR